MMIQKIKDKIFGKKYYRYLVSVKIEFYNLQFTVESLFIKLGYKINDPIHIYEIENLLCEQLRKTKRNDIEKISVLNFSYIKSEREKINV